MPETQALWDALVANGREAYGLRVINLSLGKAVLESWQDDPLVQAVERAVASGLVVVTSAGNWGTLPDGTRVRDGITSPGNAPSAITSTPWRRQTSTTAGQ